MKITIAQLNYTIGDFTGNASKMKMAVDRAVDQGADLICFSELATTGYLAGDLLEYSAFLAGSEGVLDLMKKWSEKIGILTGAPTVNTQKGGKPLFNSAYFIYRGEYLRVQHKTLLPTYDIFAESRYFESAKEWGLVEFKGKKIALTICEDIWNVESGKPVYPIDPLDMVAGDGPDFVINLSASPFHYESAARRIGVLRDNIRKHHLPFFYVNHCGGHTGILFDGGSLVLDGEGRIVDEMPYFEESVRVYDTEEVTKSLTENVQPKEKYDLIFRGLITGIRDYFHKVGLKKAVIGLSGGLDSALVCVLAARALGAENVLGVLMPGPFSTAHSTEDARRLVDNLGIRSEEISIVPGYDTVNQSLEGLFEGYGFDVTEENIQARLRGLYLMAISNKLGYTLLNTSNKSEVAVGYGTLYGDMAGGLAVIADLYKSEVFELSRYLNREEEVIPWHIIEKPPSAELRPDQKDSDSLPGYDVLDDILFRYVEDFQGAEEIVKAGHEASLVSRVLRMVQKNEFKRYQAAPVIRVSKRAFGPGQRMPLVARYPS